MFSGQQIVGVWEKLKGCCKEAACGPFVPHQCCLELLFNLEIHQATVAKFVSVKERYLPLGTRDIDRVDCRNLVPIPDVDKVCRT